MMVTVILIIVRMAQLIILGLSIRLIIKMIKATIKHRKDYLADKAMFEEMSKHNK